MRRLLRPQPKLTQRSWQIEATATLTFQFPYALLAEPSRANTVNANALLRWLRDTVLLEPSLAKTNLLYGARGTAHPGRSRPPRRQVRTEALHVAAARVRHALWDGGAFVMSRPGYSGTRTDPSYLCCLYADSASVMGPRVTIQRSIGAVLPIRALRTLVAQYTKPFWDRCTVPAAPPSMSFSSNSQGNRQ